MAVIVPWGTDKTAQAASTGHRSTGQENFIPAPVVDHELIVIA
jgi:hypothetical protein